MLGPKNLSPKNWIQHFFGPKNFGSKIWLFPKNVGQKKVGSKNVKKNLGLERNLGSNKIGS